MKQIKYIMILLCLTLLIPSASAFSPDHPAYRITIFLNDLQELLTFNSSQQIILKQHHLAIYINDLNFSNNNAYIIEKIKEKQKEVDDKMFEIHSEHIEIIKYNQEILYNLINSSTMPNQSKKGLQTAYNNSMIKIITRMHSYKNISEYTYIRQDT